METSELIIENKVVKLGNKKEFNFNPISLYSLRNGFIAYFNTYNDIRNTYLYDDNDEEVGYKSDKYSSYYIRDYINCIISFHHFFELTIKDFLAYNSELLVLSFKNHKTDDILFDLVNGNKVNIENINSIEFSQALERLCKLQKRIFVEDKIHFELSKESKAILSKLNMYRNRIMHKGRLILRYKELDEFICKELFFVINEFFNSELYNSLKNDELIFNNYSNVDIFKELLEECKNEKINYKKIQFLKEVGRASQNIPQDPPFIRNRPKWHSDRINEIVVAKGMQHIFRNLEEDGFSKCPVCGKESLITFKNFYDESSYDECVEAVKCMWCSFEVDGSFVGATDNFQFDSNNIKEDYIKGLIPSMK